jgi:hypothetical protein
VGLETKFGHKVAVATPPLWGKSRRAKMKVSDLIEVLKKCPPANEVKILGEVEGVDLDICPSVVVMHPSKAYVALLPDYGDVDVDSGEQVLYEGAPEG